MNMARKLFGAIVLLAAPSLTIAAPATNDPQAPGWYAIPSFNFVSADSQRGSGTGKGAALALGHHGEIASIEVAGFFSAMQQNNAQITGGQIALILSPLVDHPLLSRFFGVFAIGAVEETNIPAKRGKDGSGLVGDLGIGYLQPLGFEGRKVNLRIDARYRGDFQMPPHESGEPSYFRDWVFNVGVQIPLSKEPPPPPPPPPPRVVPVESTTQPATPSAPQP